MANLYEITNALMVIHAEIEDAEGELSFDLEARLDAANLALKDKAFNIGRWVKNIDADLPGLDAEIERLKRKQRQKGNLRDRLKAYLKMGMEMADIEKLEFDTFSVKIQGNGGKLPIEITNEEAVPAGFIDIIPQTTAINKDRIREAAERGDDISAFAKAERGNHLKIL